MPHAFISYKHEDLAFAEELRLFAQRMGVPIWLDANIQPGEEWRAAIDKAIAEAFAVVVIMTPEAQRSEYITYEWAFALGQHVPVIPVLLRQTTLHPKLEVLQYLDFTRGASMQVWLKLIERLEEVQGAPSPRPAPTPTPASSKLALNRLPPPATPEEEMRQSISNFFHSSGGDPVLIFGLAKDIARRLENEKEVFKSVQAQIDQFEYQYQQSKLAAHKDSQERYFKARNLEYALALVKGLGLSEATRDRNQMFLRLGMPKISRN